MSGITGWIDFERNLSQERAVVLAMTAAMAQRGPDGEGTWVSRHAAFGHRKLNISAVADGQPPVIHTENGELVAVGMHSGSILNHAELRKELRSRGYYFKHEGDTEVLLYAYLAWGPACVEHIDGTFAGAIWDARTEQLWLVRDRLGVEPLFYYPTPTGLIFGSEAKAILSHPLAEAVVDGDGLREVFTYAGTPSMAYFHGMHRLRAGHHLSFGRTGLRTAQYWKVSAAEHTDDLDTTIKTIRRLLAESVERNIGTGAEVSTLLSGGLDSSGVAALASGVLKERGETLRTFTLDFERYQEIFEPTDTRGSTDAPYAQDVVNHLGTNHTYIKIDPMELVDPIARAAVLRAKDFPTPLGDMNTSLYLLARGVREHARVTMTGEAADSLFHGVVWNRDPVESSMGTFPWVARGVVRDDANGLGCGLFDPGLLKQLDPLRYAERRYRDSIAEAPHLANTTEHERHMRELCWVHISNFMENQNAHTERLFKAVGVEVRMPYCDHRMVQYAYNLPWALQNYDGREKGLLRSALSDVLPSSVIDRRKTPYPVTLDPVYEHALRNELKELLADSTAPVLGLMDVEAAHRLLETPIPSGTKGGWARRANIELPLQLNSWLRNYGIRVAI